MARPVLLPRLLFRFALAFNWLIPFDTTTLDVMACEILFAALKKILLHPHKVSGSLCQPVLSHSMQIYCHMTGSEFIRQLIGHFLFLLPSLLFAHW